MSQKGRSMVEMLGVLAIIGVLSVGGIAGYNKAMYKYKFNKLVDEYNNLFAYLSTHHDTFKDEPSGNSIVPLLVKYGILEKKNEQGSLYMDSLGYSFFIRPYKDSFDFNLQLSSQAGTNPNLKNYCTDFVLNLIKPNHEIIKHMSLTYGIGGDKDQPAQTIYSYAGNAIANLTLDQISQFCSVCEKDKLCRIIFDIK